jgi:hypothetical protein
MLASRRFPPPWSVEVVRLYQLISYTQSIGRWEWNPIAFGSHALSVHGVISRLHVTRRLARIERLVKGPYLELFAREKKPGWDCWGNQAGLFDAGVIATRLGWTRLWPKK